jgi:hypothetical protein
MPYIATRSRAKSAPLASRSGMSAGSGVANPRAAGSDGDKKNEGGRDELTIVPIRPSATDIYCPDLEMWLPKPVVSAPGEPTRNKRCECADCLNGEVPRRQHIMEKDASHADMYVMHLHEESYPQEGPVSETFPPNPEAPIALPDRENYCPDCEMWLQKPVVSAPIALPDREKKEVGNPLRASGSSTADQAGVDDDVRELLAEDHLKRLCNTIWENESEEDIQHRDCIPDHEFHVFDRIRTNAAREHRAPSAVEQVDNLGQRSLGGVVQCGGSSISSGRGRVANPEHAVVLVTDWYASHLREDAVTRPILFIGGGTTGVAAVCDEMPHRFLAQRHRSQQPMGSGGYGARN